VIAKADTPAKPLLLAPATTSTSVTIDQAAPAPKAVAEATPAETATPDAGVPCDATRGRACLCSRSGALRLWRLCRFLFRGHDEGSYDDGTYDEGYEGAGYGDEGCF
jgi:hypothetical protein